MTDSDNPNLTNGNQPPDNMGNVRAVSINSEMRGSFLDYAMSVIIARALPDARDGLKPVHRRILFAMYDMGVRPGTAYKKSARIVGEVLGKYHPHGDSAVYDAMARMAQDFSLRYMLVDGQGNFGSIDGDSPAAMRYTEARMSRISEELLTDINMNTVDFNDNYDGTQQEPTVMPARIPNLLLNGATGIAVGMATSIPPHNMNELSQAIVYLIDRYDQIDDITVDELMEFVKGPDFPTGGEVIANEELKEAYATGKGRVVMRATHEIEEGREGMFRIVFTSFPYQIGKTSIIERIVQLVREGRLDGVRDLRDESDREGQRLVVELKRGANVQATLHRLYKYSALQSTFGIQMLALVNGEPRTLSLRRALQVFIDHRYVVIVRRSEFELDKKIARAHILEGLLKAISNLDAIIQTIRSSSDTEEARNGLMTRFDLTQPQAEAILEMQLRRLAALEQQKIQDEFDEVMARIAYLQDLLQSPHQIRALIRQDMLDVAEQYGDARRTEIIYGEADFDEDKLVAEEQTVVSLTTNGYIKRVASREYRMQNRGGKGVMGMTTKEEDTLLDLFTVNTRDKVLFFSNKGKVYQRKAWQIPETGRANKGTLAHAVLPLDQDERITAIINLNNTSNADMDAENEDEGTPVYTNFVLMSRRGTIKRVSYKDFSDVRQSGIIAVSLEEGDEVGWVKPTNGDQHIVIVTEGGNSIRFHENNVRVMGRQAGGVNSIRLIDGDLIAGMDVIKPDDTHILVVTRNGYGKRTTIDEYRIQGRYGSGIRTLARNEKTGPIVAMRCIKESDGIMLITRDGVVLRTSLNQIRETGRSTQGVRLMDVAHDDEIVGITIVDDEEEVIVAMAPVEGGDLIDGAELNDGADAVSE
ncbi:MAG TPA: DNA gyrase subunit A [Aggregatilineales bacterium]|nr:DNA gyrase subunit A [Aggregatilineales bacterium]